MENVINYHVSVEYNQSVLDLFQCSTIDEACSFALALFRSVNVPNLHVAIVRVSDSASIVTFEK